METCRKEHERKPRKGIDRYIVKVQQWILLFAYISVSVVLCPFLLTSFCVLILLPVNQFPCLSQLYCSNLDLNLKRYAQL
jgi:hypothetical protein